MRREGRTVRGSKVRRWPDLIRMSPFGSPEQRLFYLRRAILKRNIQYMH